MIPASVGRSRAGGAPSPGEMPRKFAMTSCSNAPGSAIGAQS